MYQGFRKKGKSRASRSQSLTMAAGNSNVVITLSEADGGAAITLSAAAAHLSRTISVMTAGPRAGQPLPVPTVPAAVLAKVAEYLELHAVAVSDDALLVLSKWDQHFLEVNGESLFDLVLAADFLEIEGLLRLACCKAEDFLAGMSPEEVRRVFKIRAEPTPEEMEEVRRDYPWAFEFSV